MRLSICFPVFRDFDGLYFSAGDIPLSHPEICGDVEIIVVDNDPDSASGRQTKDWIAGRLASCVRARYIAAPGPGGPALAKQRCVEEAIGDYVLVMDSHVRITRGGLAKLLQFYVGHPGSNDLYSGPLVYDPDMLRAATHEPLKNFCTHMEEVWRGHDLGIWAADPRGADFYGKPFEIPAMGAGVFTCRRKAFVGFNKNVRGFGGEEFYIYRKTRKAGGKGVCLPFLRWIHRFGRPNGVPYTLRLWDKVRNYVITHQELGFSIDPVYDHFVAVHKHTFTYAELPTLHPNKVLTDGPLSEGDWERLNADPRFREAMDAAKAGKTSEETVTFETRGGFSESDWRFLIADPIDRVDPPPAAGCNSCGAADARTLEELFNIAQKTPSPLNEHVAKLRELAAQCDVVVDLGHQSYVSTVAFLAGQPQKLLSYDTRNDPAWTRLAAKRGKTDFQFGSADIAMIDIPECDLLFEDSIHTADHVYKILAKHAGKVRRFLVVHDTTIFGETGEGGSPGVLPALRKFMRENPAWSVIYHSQANNGLTVLGKLPEDKPPLPPLPQMAWNYAKALTFHKLKGSPLAAEATIEHRADVCAGCDQRTTERQSPDAIYNRCSVCGCYLDEGPSQREGKLLWAESVCPQGDCTISHCPRRTFSR